MLQMNPAGGPPRASWWEAALPLASLGSGGLPRWRFAARPAAPEERTRPALRFPGSTLYPAVQWRAVRRIHRKPEHARPWRRRKVESRAGLAALIYIRNMRSPAFGTQGFIPRARLALERPRNGCTPAGYFQAEPVSLTRRPIWIETARRG